MKYVDTPPILAILLSKQQTPLPQSSEIQFVVVNCHIAKLSSTSSQQFSLYRKAAVSKLIAKISSSSSCQV